MVSRAMHAKHLFFDDEEAVRFHIVVFNFERIRSFISNFHKIKNFKPDRDRVLILDCSSNHASEISLLAEFARIHKWTLGKELKVLRRKNWGIDQGARIDYFTALRNLKHPPQYIWQFQEHYLDLDSSWSIWPSEMPELGGQLKADTIPDGIDLDLDHCERIYLGDKGTSVIYADRKKLGIFTHQDGREWFYADGANFSVRTRDALEIFQLPLLSTYKSIYDGSYEWTLFMEMEFGKRLTRPHSGWHDLATGELLITPEGVRQNEKRKGITLHQSAEPFYRPLYSKYEVRFEQAIQESDLKRWWRTISSSAHLQIRNSRFGRRIRSASNKVGIGELVRRIRKRINLTRD